MRLLTALLKGLVLAGAGGFMDTASLARGSGGPTGGPQGTWVGVKRGRPLRWLGRRASRNAAPILRLFASPARELEDYMSERVQFVITAQEWDPSFEEVSPGGAGEGGPACPSTSPSPSWLTFLPVPIPLPPAPCPLQALTDNPSLVFVRPRWIYSCNEKQKLLPHQLYGVVPQA